MEKDPSKAPPRGADWRRALGTEPGGPSRDVLDGPLERDWFPDETGAEQRAREQALRETVARALGLAAVTDALKRGGRGTASAAANQQVTALRGIYRTPWELALQRWLESVSPGTRTFLRPSRRGGECERADVVLPGRRREGWILNVVLDTSGSMADEIPRALGAIADFCDAVAVDQIRLVQCDTTVTADECVSPAEAAVFEVRGYGGSDLSPALLYLADDPNVKAVLVLTDGDIAYPQEPLPYDVLWVLPAPAAAVFRPPYGAVLGMQRS
jgi:predicted metal-dependent peptidase